MKPTATRGTAGPEPDRVLLGARITPGSVGVLHTDGNSNGALPLPPRRHSRGSTGDVMSRESRESAGVGAEAARSDNAIGGNNMSMFIDADAHVIETEQTWEFMEEEDKRFAPDLLVSQRDGLRYWRIDERVVPNTNLGLNATAESRELANVSARIAHMDQLSVDVQVIYPTLFLRPSDRPGRRGAGALPGLQPLARGDLEAGRRPYPVGGARAGEVPGPCHRGDPLRQGQRRLRGLHARLRRGTAALGRHFLPHLPGGQRS